MIIAISQRNMEMRKGANRDALENDYVEYYENFGIILLPIPNVCKNLEKYFDEMSIKGIILSGGNTIGANAYYEKINDDDISEERDETDKKLIQIALERKLPLLGVCRGAQFINVYFGGILIYDVKKETGVNHVATTHSINVTDKKAIDFFGKDKFTVNSYHNQGITKKTLSSELKEFAISEDGIIEGIYHPRYPIAGILWHPERPNSDKDTDRKIVEAFINGKLFWES